MKLEEFLKPGESLVFKLGWGLVTSAGETRMETFPVESDDGRRLRVEVSTVSKGIVNAIHPISNNTTSVFDLETGRPLFLEIGGKEGDREIHATTVYDYENGKIIHTDDVRPHRSGTVDLPEEPVYDLMVTILQVREWRLKPGESRRVQCLVNDEIYDLEVVARQVKTIKTPAGRFRAVEVVPNQKGELKGFFRKGGSMHFWISQEEQPQLVRMDFKTKIGTITAALVRVGEVDAEDDEDSRP